MGVWELMIFGFSAIFGLGFFVCWILVVIKAFQSEDSPLLGILCIVLCTLGTFIIGWIKHSEWQITHLMMIYSGLVVVYFALQVAIFVAVTALMSTAQMGYF